MLTLSKNMGISGSVKSSPDDFVVEEITGNGTVLELGKQYAAADLGMKDDPEGKFVVFVLQKKGWNTAQALREVARKSRRGIKSAGFAGTKDRMAVSTQLCSLFGAKAEEVKGTYLKDVSINGAWQAGAAVEMGDLLGNRFRITVRDASGTENIDPVAEELGGVFPNYFGEQRFGIRNNNAEIGVDILKGDFEGAAIRFLTDSQNEMSQDAVDARKRLAADRDFAKALDYFPRYLKPERAMLLSLAAAPTDFGKAIRSLPRSLTLMFVHAVDAHIFNKELEARLGQGSTEPAEGDLVCNRDRFGFPDIAASRVFDGTKCDFVVGNIVGYESEPNDDEKRIMDGLGLAKDDFRSKRMPELNCRGAKRVLFAPIVDFAHRDDGKNALLEFSLPSGSYATVLLSEFLKQPLGRD